MLGRSPSLPYRQQMGLCHPDKVAALGPELRKVAEERTKAINAAYAILGDPLAKAAYDRTLASPLALPPNRRPVATSLFGCSIKVGKAVLEQYFGTEFPFLCATGGLQ